MDWATECHLETQRVRASVDSSSSQSMFREGFRNIAASSEAEKYVLGLGRMVGREVPRQGEKKKKAHANKCMETNERIAKIRM